MLCPKKDKMNINNLPLGHPESHQVALDSRSQSMCGWKTLLWPRAQVK